MGAHAITCGERAGRHGSARAVQQARSGRFFSAGRRAIVSRFAQPRALEEYEVVRLADGCLAGARVLRRRGRCLKPARDRYGERSFAAAPGSGSAAAPAALHHAPPRGRPHLSERHAMEAECAARLPLAGRAPGLADALRSLRLGSLPPHRLFLLHRQSAAAPAARTHRVARQTRRPRTNARRS
jgi:hypothetical protein